MKTTQPSQPATSASAAPGRTTMQAIVQHRYGTRPEDVLRLEQVATPAIAANEVLVQVRAAAVDRGTWHLMAGQPYLMRLLGFGLRGPKSPVPGLDVAGTVVATGAGITGFWAADEVFGIARGSFAEYAAAQADKLVRKPGSLSFEQAAAVAVSGLAALQGLRAGHIQAGQKVLVIGASGGVGSYAVQLAKVCVPKTCATWAYAPQLAVGLVPRLAPGGQGSAWPGCDDFRLVGLMLIFLIVSRTVPLLRLSRRESWWKDAEILMLRHQLSVALRERPRAHSRLTWPDRAWLALLAGTVPIERLAAMRLIVTPGTILRWHRDIVRRRWARRSRRGRSGCPPVHRRVRFVVLRLARENESWGYRRIHGELAGLGITMAPSTVWQILKSAGIDPAPRRDGPGWPEFLRSQAQGILALDFFTADLLNGAKVYVLAVIEHGTRRVRVLGATGHPVQSWVVQQARNLLMDLEDAGTRVKFVLHDRDASFTAAFDAVFQAAGVRVIRSVVQAPRMNSIMERWIGSCRRELLDRTLVWNQRHL